MKKIVYVLAVLLAMFTVSCASSVKTMRGKQAEVKPPTAIHAASEVPSNQKTYHYQVVIYPGAGENFDPDPKLSLEEYNQLIQLDWYSAKQIEKLGGAIYFKEALKEGLTIGTFQAVLGATGARLGFGNAVDPVAYLAYIGLTGLGAGFANAKLTVDMMMNVAHGYCMTCLVFKASELEGKLRRIIVVPLYVGSAPLPGVSDAPAPTYPRTRDERFIPLPTR